MLRRPDRAHPEHTTRARLLRATSVAVGLLALPAVAHAGGIGVELEGGVAVPLTTPQSTIFDVGGEESAKLRIDVKPYLDVGPSASFTMLPAAIDGDQPGVVWGLGAGLRLKRPHDRDSARGVSPWVDFDALYMRTGALNRAGFSAGLGVSWPIGVDRRYWLGPFVRYTQTVQLERAGYDNRDAKLLTVGLSLEIGSGRKRVPLVVAVPGAIEVEPTPLAETIISCPDRDNDTIPDTIDRCPDVAGPMDSWGCPAYQHVVVQRDMLQLKEKIFFKFDSGVIDEVSYAVLDDVVQALKDGLGFRVQVEGHTDSTGTEAYNQTLSEQRAAAVLDYLVSHGIATDRLISKGFSESEPVDTNTTAAGRENNRRVDFVVNFIFVNNEGGTK